MATTQAAKVFHLPVDKLPPNGVFVKFNPPHLVDQLHKLDEKHYTY